MVPLSPPLSTAEHGGEAEFFALHRDIIESHILTRLDGPALASTSAVSSALRRFCSETQLWIDVCRSAWPSTAADPRVIDVISGFPNGGPRAFFAHSFRLPDYSGRSYSKPAPAPAELISAVDVRYKDRLIFTTVQETETVTAWFRCSPFRIDLLDPKDVVATPIKHPDSDGACAAFSDDMTLSWILIDPTGRRAVNLSSHKPVSVHRHWLSGEVQAKFASILAVDHRRRGHVQCGIVVTCGASEGGEMQVREVSMQMEDMDGTHLNGKDSLVILQRALEGKKGNGSRRVEEGKRRYAEFLEMKRENKERKLRIERVLDILCVAFGVSAFFAFCYFLLC